MVVCFPRKGARLVFPVFNVLGKTMLLKETPGRGRPIFFEFSYQNVKMMLVFFRTQILPRKLPPGSHVELEPSEKLWRGSAGSCG